MQSDVLILGGEIMRLKDFIKSNVWLAILVSAIAVLACFCQAYENYLISPMTNSLRNSMLNSFIFFVTMNVLMAALGYLLRYLLGYLFVKQSQGYIHQLRNKITNKYFLTEYNTTPVSEMQSRLTNDINMLSDTYLDSLINILVTVLDIVFSSVVIIKFNFYLVFLILGLAGMVLFIPKLISGPLQKATNEVSLKNSKYLDIIDKWLSGLAALQRYHASKRMIATLSSNSHQLEQATVNKEAKSDILYSINTAVNMLAQGAVAMTAGILVLNKQIEFGAFFSILDLTSLVFSQLVSLTTFIAKIQSAKKLNTRVLKSYSSLLPKTKNVENLNFFDSLAIKDLAVHFNNGENICYPNIKIKAGEKILLSGDSGTGKSTLFKLILGEISPASGEIVFKNEAGKVINPDLTQIGYIPQNPKLFPGTIIENITMFDSQLNKSANIWAKRVQLTSDLAKFPAGIDTVVDLDKGNLSGGQCQKIVLARTEVYNSKIVLIDEGTSAIDSTATQVILQNLLKSSATIIFIAHNLTPEMHKMFDREIHLTNNK